MNTTRDERATLEELLIRWEDGELGPEDTERLIRLLQENKSVRQDLVTHYLLDAGIARELNARDAREANGKPVVAPGLGMSGKRWVIPLAAAAGLTIVAGGMWWFSHRPVDLELRVVEVQGSGLKVQGSGRERENTQHPTPNIQLSSRERIKIGSTLRPGDGIDVGPDGYAKLVYPDGTLLELQRNTRMRVEVAAGREKNAKRLALDSGTLVCSAAPQKKPMEIKTVHAVARVVGTRFSLGVTAVESTLAVQEGKVELCRGEKTLLVGVEETAAASGEGLKRLSPDDVWTRELLARADAGAWNALDFAKCVTHEKDAVWQVENPGEAGNRLWRTNPKLSNHVLFESARWKRGVVVGEVMFLPEGNLPAPLAPPPSATPIPLAAPVWDWVLSDQRLGPKLLLYWDDPTEPSPSKTRCYYRVSVPIAEPGVWRRFAMYFDTEAEDGAVALHRFWPAEGEQATADVNWIWRKLPITARNTQVGFGLMAHQVPVLWRELKLMPLGPDMPPPPSADRTNLTKGY